MTYFQEIKTKLENGEQFENTSADWYTLNNPNQNRRIIVIGTESFFYKNMDSYAKRVKQLINRGF